MYVKRGDGGENRGEGEGVEIQGGWEVGRSVGAGRLLGVHGGVQTHLPFTPIT